MRPQATCTGDENVPRNMARWGERNAKVLSGNVSFGESINNPTPNGQNTDNNMDVWKFEGNSGVAANTPFTLKHSLSDPTGKPRVPICIVGQVTKDGGVIYGDWTTWTNTTITLKSTTANTPYRLIIA